MPVCGRSIVKIASERGGHSTAPDRLIGIFFRRMMGQGLLGVLSLDASLLEHGIWRIPCCYRCSLWYDPRSFPQRRSVTEVRMKPDIHPEYREVLFHDTSSDTFFIIGSTVATSDTRDYEGQTYPYMSLDISSASHPFYTGKQKVAQSDGRVARFNKRFGDRSLKS